MSTFIEMNRKMIVNTSRILEFGVYGSSSDYVPANLAGNGGEFSIFALLAPIHNDLAAQRPVIVDRLTEQDALVALRAIEGHLRETKPGQGLLDVLLSITFADGSGIKEATA